MLIRPSAVVLTALLAGCAPTAPPSAPDGPAARSLPTAPLAVTRALPPVAAPALPTALRTGPTPGTAPMDHAAHGYAMPAGSDAPDPAAVVDHAAMGHTVPAASPTTALRPDALAPAVEAYLALQTALADDRFEAGDVAAASLAAALVRVDVEPELQAHAVAADAATDLVALRAAFGQLSPSFIALVERVGAPAGVELSAFRCGMADAPQGGVWLQATGDLANPYYGAAMRTCGRHTGTVGAAHETMGHGAGDYETQHD